MSELALDELAAGTILSRPNFGLMRKRYYFDVREGEDVSADDEGMELATLEAVQAEAARALTEMARDAVRNRPHGVGHHIIIEVRDDDGPVLQVNFTLAIVRLRH